MGSGNGRAGLPKPPSLPTRHASPPAASIEHDPANAIDQDRDRDRDRDRDLVPGPPWARPSLPPGTGSGPGGARPCQARGGKGRKILVVAPGQKRSGSAATASRRRSLTASPRYRRGWDRHRRRSARSGGRVDQGDRGLPAVQLTKGNVAYWRCDQSRAAQRAGPPLAVRPEPGRTRPDRHWRYDQSRAARRPDRCWRCDNGYGRRRLGPPPVRRVRVDPGGRRLRPPAGPARSRTTAPCISQARFAKKVAGRWRSR
ncbi:hypothetical protein DFJ67_4696 [Asanoa ferruginea]|uniref:Uncharacterized protein n=1 Tax=Asanoa ferruginea TaxID=53367 RepID=A0A3D9ZMU3_9ACTN|nr:hypothetical protein DFJ67_4696 [Asanoa ferruginea]